MKKIIVSVIAIIMIFGFTACTDADSDTDTNKIKVAVGIVPEATFVEKVAGDLVEIVTLIPPGNSPANYQPTAVQMQSFSEASVYFSMQTPTEEANILPKVKDFNKDVEVILLRDIVKETYPVRMVTGHSHSDDEDHDDEENHDDEDTETTADPHIWLSPKRVIIIVQTIADKLSEIDSDNSSVYQENAKTYIKQLQEADAEISKIAESLSNKTFLIYHGSYGYFAEDYGLTMISLESEGKQVTVAKMQEVIDYALSESITTVYYQEEFDDNQAKTVAEEIGGTVRKASPLSYDYINSLKDFAHALSHEGD